MNKLANVKTLGDYLKLVRLLGAPKAIAFFEKKIAGAPMGAKEPVIADETQMLALIGALLWTYIADQTRPQTEQDLIAQLAPALQDAIAAAEGRTP